MSIFHASTGPLSPPHPPVAGRDRTVASPTSPPRRRAGGRRTLAFTFVIAIGLLVSFWVQYPTSRVGDWSEFSFWDPGAVLKADAMLGRGMVPTIDFGYTHGLIPLAYGRLGFGLLGRTPAAYFVMTLLAEMGMAWGAARIFAALELGWWPWMVFVAGIPLAVMPAYLTLAHPLEAMLILLALAEQAEGRRGRALALLAACLFVKPSMAYVHGLAVVVFIGVNTWPHVRLFLRAMVPAAITFVVLFLALGLRFGARAVVNTLIPLTGAKSYAATGFGFFAAEGRKFWASGDPWIYWKTPAGIFLFAAGAILAGGIFCLPGFVRRLRGAGAAVETGAARRGEILVTAAILHTAFLTGFYGWTGSWTYYSYLPVLGVVILLEMAGARAGEVRGVTPGKPGAIYNGVRGVTPGEPGAIYDRVRGVTPGEPGAIYDRVRGVTSGEPGAIYDRVRGVTPGEPGAIYDRVRGATPGKPGAICDWARGGIALGLVVWMVGSQTRLAGEVGLAWKEKTPTRDGLYVYASEMKEWRGVLRMVGGEGSRAVVMTIGFLPDLPEGVEMMDAWFPEPGIPTGVEVARVKRQVAGAEFVILWKQYGRFDLWRSEAFARERGKFAVEKEGEFFVVMRRRGGGK